MSDGNGPGPFRSGGFQPIEPVGATPVPSRPEPPAPPPPSPDVDYAARFGSAAAALVYCGQLRSIGHAADMKFRTGRDHSWWAIARLDLSLAREFTRLARGEGYVGVGTATTLVPDIGWGPAPTAAVSGDSDAVRMSDLAAIDQSELIRIAGLRKHADGGLREVSVLLSGSVFEVIVRRAADLGLGVTHRIVRLAPLFSNSGHGRLATAEPLTSVELRLRARTGEVPQGLVRALARDKRLTVCRRVSGASELLIEYGHASPLPDRQLADAAIGASWLLSRGALGSRTVEPVGAGAFVDSTSLLRLSDSQPLDVQEPCGGIEDDAYVRPLEVRLIRARTPGQAVDAILLADGDLTSIGLVLEGHPLAESAMVVRGRDRHLLLAPGGLLEELPVGEPLYCLGPGLLYLPLGRGTKPRMPTGARRELFDVSEQAAVVLTRESRLRFDLKWSEPVWRLWVGPLPPIDDQLPDETLAELEDMDRPPPPAEETPDSFFNVIQPDPADAQGRPALASGQEAAGGSAQAQAQGQGRGTAAGSASAAGVGSAVPGRAAGPGRPTRTRTWLDDAWQAELRGDLQGAAALHERHGDPLRAARLYERAFQLDAAETTD